MTVLGFLARQICEWATTRIGVFRKPVLSRSSPVDGAISMTAAAVQASGARGGADNRGGRGNPRSRARGSENRLWKNLRRERRN